ncbi:Fe-S-containing hydro-lyase [Ammoniphilus resinae]|uniref:Fumarate hydratase subunit beta n=1 Tax=Ammoniphilus resinae TaxID=861532 RepID=A0ABS4GJ62_9BACL|nr:Fe-S-containing hydro-lyase [Ammoniphilus resinae]MBP1930290.1 fumarate hydratase subunit beta [Ammoniphilus resinae]
MSVKEISLPFNEDQLSDLRSGDRVLLTGSLFTARDAAHRRMFETLEAGGDLPISITGQTIYYVGPTPSKPGQVIGSAGPTTSGRMDKYAPKLIELGLKGMIGKGRRQQAVKDAMQKHKAVYFAAVGGAAALIAKSIKKAEVIAYHDLGSEAIYHLEVERFPVIVINDIYGSDLYEEGEERFRIES